MSFKVLSSLLDLKWIPIHNQLNTIAEVLSTGEIIQNLIGFTSLNTVPFI